MIILFSLHFEVFLGTKAMFLLQTICISIIVFITVWYHFICVPIYYKNMNNNVIFFTHVSLAYRRIPKLFVDLVSNLHEGNKTRKENHSTFLVVKELWSLLSSINFHTIILGNNNRHHSCWQSYNKTSVSDF